MIAADLRPTLPKAAYPAPAAAQLAGIKELFGSYLALSDHDQLILVFDQSCHELASWILSYGADRMVPITAVAVTGSHDLTIVDRLTGVIDAALARHLPIAVLTLEANAGAAFRDFLRLELGQRPGVRVVRVIGCIPESFEIGLAPLHDLRRADADLIGWLGSATSLRLESGGAASAMAVLADGERWVSSGQAGSGTLMLPAGGVRARLASLTGTFVADGAISVNRALRCRAVLNTAPATLTCDDGQVTSVSCPDAAIETLLRRGVERPDCRRVASVTLGGSPAIGRYVPLNNVLNQRYPGIHLTLSSDGESECTTADEHLRIDLSACGGRVVSEGRTLRLRPAESDGKS